MPTFSPLPLLFEGPPWPVDLQPSAMVGPFGRPKKDGHQAGSSQPEAPRGPLVRSRGEETGGRVRWEPPKAASWGSAAAAAAAAQPPPAALPAHLPRRPLGTPGARSQLPDRLPHPFLHHSTAPSIPHPLPKPTAATAGSTHMPTPPAPSPPHPPCRWTGCTAQRWPTTQL